MCRRFASRSLVAGLISLAVSAATGMSVWASVVEFPQDLSGFTAAAGSSAVSINFDDIATGTDIGGTTIGGANFSAVGSPLMVVDAAGTSTSGTYTGPFDGNNRLIATSGANVVSPGGSNLPPGPDPTSENDDLQITFAQPVGYFGLDHLSQQGDGTAYSRIGLYDSADNLLLETDIPIKLMPAGEDGVVPGGVDFFGVVSDANNIAKVIINERDENDNAPDNNVGYDSLRFGQLAVEPPPTSIPLPAAVATFPPAAALAFLAARYFRRG